MLAAFVVGAILAAAATTAGAEHYQVVDPSGRVSVASDGAQGDRYSEEPALSGDGRFVVFYSDSDNLVPGDGGFEDVFVRDRLLRRTERVSVDSNGVGGDAGSGSPSISADGRFVAFESRARNLVAGDTNGVPDVFVHDRTTGQTTRISVATGGGEADGRSGDPAVSGDGRYVAFESNATNLVAGDTNGVRDVFVHDRATGTTARVSVTSAVLQADGQSNNPAISDDGNLVAFTSEATNLVAGDTNLARDVFVHDRTTAETARVSVASDGSEACSGRNIANECELSDSSEPSISGEGRHVVFTSRASNLVPADSNAERDVFVHDRAAGTTTLITVGVTGLPADGTSGDPSISRDGTRVAFSSNASNLVPGDTNDTFDVFLQDLRTATRSRVNVAADGTEANGTSYQSVISPDGGVVAFSSAATNLVVGDTNGWEDVFVATPTRFVSVSPVRLLDTRVGNGAPVGPVGPGGVVELQVTGRGGVPAAGVSAVVVNVTSTESDAASFVTVWPTGGARPLASSLNTDPGQDTPNLVVAKVGAGGRISLYNNAGSGHLVADVVGWYPEGAGHTAVEPLATPTTLPPPG